MKRSHTWLYLATVFPFCGSSNGSWLSVFIIATLANLAAIVAGPLSHILYGVPALLQLFPLIQTLIHNPVPLPFLPKPRLQPHRPKQLISSSALLAVDFVYMLPDIAP